MNYQNQPGSNYYQQPNQNSMSYKQVPYPTVIPGAPQQAYQAYPGATQQAYQAYPGATQQAYQAYPGATQQAYQAYPGAPQAVNPTPPPYPGAPQAVNPTPPPYPGAPVQYQFQNPYFQPQYQQYQQAYAMPRYNANAMAGSVPPAHHASYNDVPQPTVSPYQKKATPNMRNTIPIPDIKTDVIPANLEPPSMQYIPPNPACESLQFFPKRQNYFANLYSILASINVLVDLFVSDILERNEMQSKLNEQLQKLQNTMSTCQIHDIDGIRKFANMTKLDISYADHEIMEFFANKNEPKPQAIDPRQVSAIGSSIAELDNTLFLVQTPSDYNKFRDGIYSMLLQLTIKIKSLFPDLSEQVETLEKQTQFFYSNQRITNMETFKIVKQKIQTSLSVLIQ